LELAFSLFLLFSFGSLPTIHSLSTIHSMKLLCISNGHGEDAIALPILQELQRLPQPPAEIVALPIVGVGRAYTDNGLPIAGTVQTLPSGGFNQDSRQLLRDLRGGLLGLTIDQIRTANDWAKSGGKILAVGDIVPLAFAWMSGAEYAFVGTAKSEYYIRDRRGQILPSQRNSLEAKTGGYYFPWERWLLSQPKCRAMFARDRLTAEILHQQQIPAFDLGNPMTDGVAADFSQPRFYGSESVAHERARPLVVTLLPGSRPPEADANWEQLIIAANSLIPVCKQRSLVFLAAIDPKLDLDILQRILQSNGWVQQLTPTAARTTFTPDPSAIYYQQQRATLVLSTRSYRQFVHAGDCAIAMAGTATEQFISLGKPAVIVPGKGPQFTPAFAEAQTRLLGESVILVPQAQDVGVEIDRLFQQPDRLQSIAQNGLLRMGTPGAARRIAECLMKVMGDNPPLPLPGGE
jgi:uncharacterized protein (TIGR03492 family)